MFSVDVHDFQLALLDYDVQGVGLERYAGRYFDIVVD